MGFQAAGGVKGARRKEKADAKREKAAKRRKIVDPNKPKKAPSAYWLWLGDNRAAIFKEVGGKDVTKVSKLGGERWKKVTAKDKAPYEKKAAELKAAYEKALEEWKKTKGDDAEDDEEEENEEEEQ